MVIHAIRDRGGGGADVIAEKFLRQRGGAPKNQRGGKNQRDQPRKKFRQIRQIVFVGHMFDPQNAKSSRETGTLPKFQKSIFREFKRHRRCADHILLGVPIFRQNDAGQDVNFITLGRIKLHASHRHFFLSE